MSVDYIRYDILTQDALRGVLRSVLSDAATNGLPGEHHFFITFDTQAEGVKLSPRLRAQYPQEMTIVLQHQFWDLTVTPEAFEVGLSFHGIPERLTVPLAAIKAFFDPSVQFGLQFSAPESGEEKQPSEPASGAELRSEDEPGAATSLPLQDERAPAPHDAPPEPANPAPKAGPDAAKPAGGEVVRLDRFRKK